MTTLTLRAQELSELQALASILWQSKFFNDVHSEAQAAAKVIAGRELGLGPMESMRAFHVVDGKVEMSADLLAQRVKAHPKYDYTVATISNDECSIVFWENGSEIGTSTFTMEDRATAGIPLATRNGEPSTWAKYPRNMLFARAMSNGVAWFCPDVAGGSRLFVEGEIGPEWDEPSSVIDIEASGVPDTTGEKTRSTQGDGTLEESPEPRGPGAPESTAETPTTSPEASGPPVSPSGDARAPDVPCPSCNVVAVHPGGDPNCPTCGGVGWVPAGWAENSPKPMAPMQVKRIEKMADELGEAVEVTGLNFETARLLISEMTKRLNAQRKERAKAS